MTGPSRAAVEAGVALVRSYGDRCGMRPGPDTLAAAYRTALTDPAAWPGELLADPAVGLGAVHQHAVGEDRRARGVWFTPPWLVEHLLDLALDPLLDEASDPLELRVVDPACGSGVFLVAVARRLAARAAVPLADALPCVAGVDVDPAAVALTEVCLVLAARGEAAGREHARPDVHCADALGEVRLLEAGRADLVIGNPPFGGRLRGPTAVTPERAAGWSGGAAGVLGPYTDVSAAFLFRALRWVRPGGRVALVQPQSLLAARDAAGVRRALAAGGALTGLWASERAEFGGTATRTCAVVMRTAAEQGPVRRTAGAPPRALPHAAVRPGDLDAEWSFLLAPALGVPELVLPVPGKVGDLARCTADFRDQYYGLAGHVREAADGPGAPLVTTGLVDPAACAWGRRPARFQHRDWQAPVVDPARLPPALAGWAQARLVPKLLVAPQGRVVEAVADPGGRWLPGVPLVSVVPQAETDLWRLLAVLLAPPVTAWAAARFAGTGRTSHAIRLSARQVAQVPLPADAAAWDEAAALVRRAQEDPAGRRTALAAAGRVMCGAYGVAAEPVTGWWADRAALTRRR